MKRVTLLCGLLLALTATVAAAGPGVGLHWNACLGDGGAVNKNFACNSNNGTNNLVGTFELGAALPGVVGTEIVIDFASAGASLPAWWQFRNAGTCRQASLVMNATISPLAVNCLDWGQGAAAGGIGAYNVGTRGPNTARLVAALAVAASGAADLEPGTEYFSYNLLINNAKTVGTGSCAGCNTAVCIVFNSINVVPPAPAPGVKLTGPSNGTDADFATWQGGAGITVPPGPWGPGGSGCGGATATTNKTWGAVKSLYR
jgi:hypothetical protein